MKNIKLEIIFYKKSLNKHIILEESFLKDKEFKNKINKINKDIIDNYAKYINGQIE